MKIKLTVFLILSWLNIISCLELTPSMSVKLPKEFKSKQNEFGNKIALSQTRNGYLHAFNFRTGEIIWSLGDPENIMASNIIYLGHKSIYIEEDGTIYIVSNYQSNFKIDKLPITIKQMVERSPLKIDSWSIIGSKRTRILGISFTTGEVVMTMRAKESQKPNEKWEKLLKVVETYYSLKAVNMINHTDSWQFSTRDYSLLKQSKIKRNLEYFLQSEYKGKYTLRNIQGEKIWGGMIESPINQIFTINADLEISEMAVKNDFETDFYRALDPISKMNLLTQRKESQFPVKIDPISSTSNSTKNDLLKGDTNRLRSANSSLKDLEIKIINEIEAVFRKNFILIAFSAFMIIIALFYQRHRFQEKLKPQIKLKFSIYRDNIIGRGSNGTIVYKGELDGREVAVKRVLKDELKRSAQTEIDMLLQLDEHPCVLRYFAKDEDEHFVYIALELCECSLHDLVELNKQKLNEKIDEQSTLETIKMKNIIKDILKGLLFLHSKNIVHRDLKPQNILIRHNNTAKVSDMGLSKKLNGNQSAFDTTASGSFGWQAPEVINEGRQTKAIDIFALGCIIFYLLTNGKHPFGSESERNNSVFLHKKPFLKELDFDPNSPPPQFHRLTPSAIHLIETMLHPFPKKRLHCNDALNHPFFWEKSKRLSFLCAVSNRLEKEPVDSSLRNLLESRASMVLGDNWGHKIGRLLTKNLGKFRFYDFRSVRDLLRVIRNKAFHYNEMDETLKKEMGQYPEEFLDFFTGKFPRLFLYSFLVVGTGCRKDGAFSPFFNAFSENFFMLVELSSLGDGRDWYPVWNKLN